MQAEQLSISKMAALYGLTLRALRFYEDRGLLRPRRVGTARFYTSNDRIRIELILKGKQLGFTLSEIEALIFGASGDMTIVDRETASLAERLDSSGIARQITVLERKRDQITSALEELRDALRRSEDVTR